MTRLVLITVGTSLLTNRTDPAAMARPWSGWMRGTALPAPASARAFLATADPVRACAETHTLHKLPLHDGDRLAWLFSHTDEGAFCATALHEHYQAEGYRSTLHCIDGLTYRHDMFVERGLHDLLNVSFTLITDAQRNGYDVTICATGGFKVEISYLNLVGALLGIEVCYIHELSAEVMRMPPLPITWNLQNIGDDEDFFRWIDAEPRATPRVEQRLHGREHLRSLLYDDSDGKTYLSAAGDLLYRAYKEQAHPISMPSWPQPSGRPPAEKDQLSTVAHHRPPGWERVVQHLTEIDCVTSVRFDGDWTGQKAHSIPSVYRITQSDLGILIGTPDLPLPLWVTTTATSEAQVGRVRQHVEGNIARWG